MKILFTLLIVLYSFTSASITRVAAVNFQITGGKDLTAHLKRIDELAALARKQEVRFLLLPELISFDLLSVNPEEKKIPTELGDLAKKYPDYEAGLKTIALKHSLNLVGASTVVKSETHFINRAFFISAKGKVHHQDKLYPTPWEKKYGFKGGKKIDLFTHDGIPFVILTCHDAEFPSVSSFLVPLRPEVIFVPSQTDNLYGLERVRATSQARAIEHFAYVIMTGASGMKEAPWHTYVGRNFLFTPQNKYFPEKSRMSVNQANEELSIFQLDLETLRTARKDKSQVYPARDQR